MKKLKNEMQEIKEILRKSNLNSIFQKLIRRTLQVDREPNEGFFIYWLYKTYFRLVSFQKCGYIFKKRTPSNLIFSHTTYIPISRIKLGHDVSGGFFDFKLKKRIKDLKEAKLTKKISKRQINKICSSINNIQVIEGRIKGEYTVVDGNGRFFALRSNYKKSEIEVDVLIIKESSDGSY